MIKIDFSFSFAHEDVVEMGKNQNHKHISMSKQILTLI